MKVSIKQIMYGGVNAMQAQRNVMSLAGKNIANANTPNYTRQRSVLLPKQSQGLVVEAQAPTAVRSTFVLKSLLGAKHSQGFNESKTRILRLVEPAFNDLDDSGINAALADFYAAAGEVATNAENIPERRAFLSAARHLAHTINVADHNLEQSGNTAEREVGLQIKQANKIFAQLADLNRQIVTNKGFGDPSHELIDEQEGLLKELSGIVNISFIRDEKDTVSVSLSSGTTMVTGIQSNAFEQTNGGPNPIDIAIKKFDGSIVKPIDVFGGKLGGLIHARDVTIASSRKQLDQLAFDAVEKVNSIHKAGFGLDGSTNNDLYEPIGVVTGAARVMKLSSAVDGQPEKVAAAKVDNLLPGDNENMLDIVALQSDTTVVGGTKSMFGAYDDIVSNVSVSLNLAEQGQMANTVRVQRFEQLRDSVSSVSLQEEMVQISQAERAFQASSRVIQVASELLDTLLKMV